MPPSKTPDFEVDCGDVVVFAEVKQYEKNPEHDQISAEMDKDGGHVGRVDFESDKWFPKKLKCAAAQLKSACERGHPTVLVIYSMRFLGTTDYVVENILRKKTITIPKEVSAVLRLKNVNITPANPPYEVFRNSSAKIALPETCFPEHS